MPPLARVAALAVVPEGAVLATAPAAFSLNRLEVSHVHVTDADGTVRLVPGTFRLERLLPSGKRERSACVFRTKSGVDLLGGTYDVETTAKTTGGQVVVHRTTVTLP